MKKVAITGGGTGGHVFPALSIADEFKERGYEVLYVGTARGMEAKLVPERGFRFFTVDTGAVKNQSAVKKIKTLFALARGIFWAICFLRKEKPVAVIGVGGYVSFPLSIAAFVVRLPLYLQEQNSSVGIANSFLGKLATKIFLGFEGALNYFPKHKCIVTGNPLRAAFFQNRQENFDPSKKNIIVLGGSQGAQSINAAILKVRERLFDKFPDLTIYHQAGGKNAEALIAQAGEKYRNRHQIFAFCEDMISLYEKASLVIARSGAITVTELIQMNRPAILIPLPRIGQNDQVDNAKYMEKLGGAHMIEQKTGFEELLIHKIEDFFSTSKLQTMHESLQKVSHNNPVKLIADEILTQSKA